MWREVSNLENEKMVDVEIVVENGVYSNEVNLETANFMLKADIVTIKKTSVTVKEIEVTDKGKIRFHGNIAEM